MKGLEVNTVRTGTTRYFSNDGGWKDWQEHRPAPPPPSTTEAEQLCFRIYIEDVNYLTVNKIVGDYFNSYSNSTAGGYWLGQHEFSCIYEIITPNEPGAKAKVKEMAEKMRLAADQDAVLVTCSIVDTILLEG